MIRGWRIWAGLILFLPNSVGWLSAQSPEDRPAPVVVSPIIKTTRAGSEQFIGTVQPIRKVIVGAAVEGRVAEVLVEAGDAVGADSSSDPQARGDSFLGQPLVRLDTQTAKIQRDAAETALELARLELQELQARLPTDRALLEAKLAEAAAALRFSKEDYERLQKSGNSVSITERESARWRYEVDRQTLAAAESALEQFDTIRQIRVAQAQSRLVARQTELARWNDTLDKHTIRAPFEGFITAKLTEVGGWVNSGQGVVEMVQLDPIEWIVDIPQSHLGRLQTSIAQGKTDVQIEFEGIEQIVEGQLVGVIPQADLRMRTFPVRIRLNNIRRGDSYLIQPGMIGRGRLVVGSEREMLLVKKDALVLGGERPVLLVLVEQGDGMTVERVPVQTGDSWGDWIQVEGPLPEDGRVVVRGNERLRPGQKVNITATDTDAPPEG